MRFKMLKAKIANNPYTQEKGLMFVESMADDEGMLFVWKRPQRLSFWGRNTFIPLDIAFIDDKFRIVKIGTIEPHSLKAVASDHSCPYALEVNAGYFSQHSIKVGDKCKFDDAPKLSHNVSREFDMALVSFEKEGQTLIPEKDISSQLRNFKKSQSLSPNPTKVEKPGEKVIGEPVTEQVGTNEVPVVDISQLGSILEDSFDEQGQDIAEDGNKPPEQEQEAPQEPEKEYPIFSSSFQAAQWAMQSGEVMRISYTTKHGRSLVRDVEPHGTFHSESTHREVLVVFDETVNDIRAFIMSNVFIWAFLGKQFEKKFVVKS
jgi:uncharacterized membrane protein (UPF0127 family)